MSVGNDVVDLGDPETRLSGLHPRFAERVFSSAERDVLEASGSRHRAHWALWAAKESAYKAQKRLAAQTVFSPREFEVRLSPRPAWGAAAVASGWVLHRDRRFVVRIHLDGRHVHAVATVGEAIATDADPTEATGPTVLWQVEQAPGEPGIAVRRLAANAIGRALGLDPAVLRIAGRPPVATYEGRQLSVDLSLSHHGRFVAFACVPAQPGPTRA